MRTNRYLIGAALGLVLSSPAYALTPVGESISPEGAPPIARVWQEQEAERGDIHWTFALQYATAAGIIGPDATDAEEAEATINVMRMILQSPLNDDATWGRDGRYPTFIDGNNYYLPVMPEAVTTVIAPSVAEEVEVYFENLREEMEGRIDTFNATLAELDLETLRDDVVGAAALAARLGALESQPFGLTTEEAARLATANRFVELLQSGNLDEAAALQTSIQSLVNEAIAAERELRVAADAAIGERIDEVENRVFDTDGNPLFASAADLEGLQTQLFDADGNLIVPEADVLGILEREGLVENGQLIIDLEGHSALEPFTRLFDTDGTPLFVTTEAFEEFKQGLSPLATMPWWLVTTLGLGLVLLLAAGINWLMQRDVRRKVNDKETGLEATHQMAADNRSVIEAQAFWHDDNVGLEDLSKLSAGVDNAVVWMCDYAGETYTVKIWREDDTPPGQVKTDIVRNAGSGQLSDPMAIKRLKTRIVTAISDGRLQPMKQQAVA